MNTQKKYNVIGIMSGTSMDGIDCSYIKTNGSDYVSLIVEKSYEYSSNYKKKLKKIIKYINKKKSIEKNYIKLKEDFITKQFLKTIKKFIKKNNIKYSSVDFIGLSGHTILHDPKRKKSIQMGSCKEIQKKLKIKVIGNFRDNDIKNGGQGAPIGAFYHNYILKNYYKYTAIINLGGISNLCYRNDKELIAFDVGPANVLIDDLMMFFYKKNFDKNGEKAFKGKVNEKIFDLYKKDKYFKLDYPKSLDRENFKQYFDKLKKLNKNDAIHTASIMTVEAIILGLKLLNRKIKTLILSGGGRKNLFITNNLKKILKTKKIKVILVDQLNFDGDMLESQAFGYLAIRSYLKLPLSIPSTTGVKKPTSGGEIFK